jgi:hypothetical protein
MNQSEFLVALFGRPVWFHCRRCERVKVAETEEDSQETWQQETLAMEKHKVSPGDLWWFDAVCNACQIRRRS